MSFEQYFNSLGPEKISTYAKIPRYEGGEGPWVTVGYGEATRPDVAFGASVGNPQAAPDPYSRYQGYGGYRDSDGNFLGYGSDPNSVYNNSPDLQRQYSEYVQNEPQRKAQELKNQQLAAEYARLEQEAIVQQREQVLPTLANFNPAPQQMGGGLMGQQPQQQMPQPMQQQQQMPQPMQQQPMQQQGGLMNYTHRGNMGGIGGMGGMAGGLHRGGLIAPSGSNGGGQ